MVQAVRLLEVMYSVFPNVQYPMIVGKATCAAPIFLYVCPTVALAGTVVRTMSVIRRPVHAGFHHPPSASWEAPVRSVLIVPLLFVCPSSITVIHPAGSEACALNPVSAEYVPKVPIVFLLAITPSVCPPVRPVMTAGMDISVMMRAAPVFLTVVWAGTAENITPATIRGCADWSLWKVKS